MRARASRLGGTVPPDLVLGIRLLSRLISILAAPAAAGAFTTPPDPSLSTGEVLVLSPDGIRRDMAENAQREGLLVVDLSDDWAPFIFGETDGPGAERRPNEYRKTFVALANDRTSPEALFLESPAGRAAVLGTVPALLRSAKAGELSRAESRALERAWQGVLGRRKPNFLEVYGIPPTLSVLARRVAEDQGKTCYATVDLEGLRWLDGEVSYQNHEKARRDFAEAIEDAAWAMELLAPVRSDGWPARAAAEPLATRLERFRRGQVRLRAVGAAQARLECEGLLSAGRYTPGAFDLSTHLALADFERKNEIFGWGFLGGETQAALARAPMELHFDTFRRVLAERVADAAGIIEDGSVSKGEKLATYIDAAGEVRAVPNLTGEFVDRLLQEMHVSTPEDLASFLHAVGPESLASLRVAFRPPPLPPYYEPVMALSAEIDRGDVWYDFPFDAGGRPLVQSRRRYPSFTLFVTWREQKIPLVRWRTTIGSWRSERHPDGRVYLKYKNSDVGPRIWKHIVAAPVWVPPDQTPGRDLVTSKVFDPKQGPVSVVNTEVMGPGFASAYGLVMAVHLKKLPGGGLFDNKIRTHGSVDYTSIARRFSHGCHRLVNDRAVRLFDFLLKHRNYERLGDRPLHGFKRRFQHRGRTYAYRQATRGYYYELVPPVPVMVHSGRILGRARWPWKGYLPKPGVDYGPIPADSPIELVPVLGP